MASCGGQGEEDLALCRAVVLEIAREFGRLTARDDFLRQQADCLAPSPRAHTQSDIPSGGVRDCPATQPG
jgi:hypothetical protein